MAGEDSKKELMLRWQRGDRFYIAHLHRDLLGDWCLVRTWGVTGSSKGQRMSRRVFDSYADAFAALEKTDRRRMADGYELASAVKPEPAQEPLL